jgi:hypothetical protein
LEQIKMCLIFSCKGDFYMNSGVSKVRTYQSFNNIQYGYIVLPKDVDRDKFIEQCYRWERVSILIERGGGLTHECYITKNAIAEITFPLTYDALGSCVLLLTDPFSGLPVVFGVLSKEDESQLLQEGYFKFAKKWQDSGVTISGDAKKGLINITVQGGTVSQLNISAINQDKTATLNLRCSGNITIDAEETFQVKPKLFKINSGDQAMVLGDELKAQLDATNTYLSALNIAIGAGLSATHPSYSAAAKAAYDAAMAGQNPGDYSDIKSEESFLD